MNAETSDRVAGLAAVLVHLGEDDIIQAAAPGNAAKLADLASDIRAVAASALRQREQEIEITGSATPPQSFYDRLIAERMELFERLRKLSDFIGHERPTVSVHFAKLEEQHKLFLRAQHSFMAGYLMALDLRITDIQLSTGQTSATDTGAYVPPFPDRMQSLGEKLVGTATDEAVRHRAEMGQALRCTCGESKAPCPVHEPDLQDAGPGDGDDVSWPGEGGTSDGNMRTTARQSDKPGEIIEEGVRFTKPDPDEPLPFNE